MRQSNNTLFIEGYLNKKDLEIKAGKNGNYIKGTIFVRVSEKNIIPVEVYSTEFTKTGKENPSFTSLSKALREYQDATEAGSWKEADKVRISTGKIDTNEWVDKNTNEITTKVKYSGSFITRVTDEFIPQAKFKNEIIIKKIAPEVIKDEETGRGTIDGYYVDYYGNIKPVNFVAGGKIWQAIEKKFENGETWLVSGDIVNQPQIKIIESDIGENMVDTDGKYINERQILSAKNMDETSYTEDEIKAAIKAKQQEYQKMIEEKKAEKEFEGKKETIEDDDLPF